MSDNANKKNLLFISRQAPYGTNKSQQCLDIALAAAVYDQNVSYVFLADAVYHLIENQNAKEIDSKPFGAALETIELYGIQKLFVDESSLKQRNLRADQLLLEASVINNEQLANLISDSDSVFTL